MITFGRFQLTRPLGEGGMAEIFLAEAPVPTGGTQRCVIKRMHAHLAQQQQFVDMFLTEADICTFLSHPNLIEVYEAGEIDGQYYMAMEYADGFELAAFLDLLNRYHIACPVELAVWATMCLARALDYLHRATTLSGRELNLVHRDVNPTNIYLLRNGTVKLGDLGVASVSFIEGGEVDAPIKGKLRYLAPELLMRQPTTPRLDLYCLGVTLWEMVTARRAFVEPSDEQVMLAIVEKGLPSARSVRAEVPRELDKLIARVTHTDPSKRFATAGEFYRGLKRFAEAAGHQYDSGKLAIFVEYIDELQRGRSSPEVLDRLQSEPPELTALGRDWRWPVWATVALTASAIGGYFLLK